MIARHTGNAGSLWLSAHSTLWKGEGNSTVAILRFFAITENEKWMAGMNLYMRGFRAVPKRLGLGIYKPGHAGANAVGYTYKSMPYQLD